MEFKTVKTVKPGEYIKRTETASKVYIRGEYDKSLKKYWLQSCDDISSGLWVKGSALVFLGFTY